MIRSVGRAGSRKTATSPFFSYGAALVAARCLPVIALLIASARLNPDQFGVLAVFVMGLTTASLVADSGFDSAATYMISRAPNTNQPKHLVGNLATVKMTTSLVVLLAITSTTIAETSTTALQGFIIVTLSAAATVFTARNSASRIAMRVSGVGERASLMLEKFVSSAIFIAVACVSTSTTFLIYAYTVSLLVGCLVATRRMPTGDIRFDPRLVKKIILSSTPFILSALAAAGIWRLATFVLANTGKVADAGYFTLAYYPVQILSSVPVFAAPLLLIKGSSHNQARVGVVARTLRLGLIACITGCSVCLFAYYVLPDVLVDRDVVVLAGVLCLSLPFLFVNPILTASLRAAGKMWQPSLLHVLAFAVSAPLIVLYIPEHGARGAAACIVLAEFIISLGLGILYKQKLVTRRPVKANGFFFVAGAGLAAVLSGFLVTEYRGAPQLLISVIVIAIALVTDRRFKSMPLLVRPGLAVVVAAVGAGVFAIWQSSERYEAYLAMWSLQMLGFVVGLLVFGATGSVAGRAMLYTRANENYTRRVARVGLGLLALSITAFLAFVTTQGVPILGTDIEQGRVDAASSGTGYLRLVIYLIVPAAAILFAARNRYRWVIVGLAAIMILALGNRSPLLYLAGPLFITTLLGGSKQKSSWYVLSIVVLGMATVASIGTFRIASQAEFASYSEYREDLAQSDYIGVAWTSVSQYAEVVADNAILTKELVDAGSIPVQLGQTYFTLFVTALPGEQLSLDRVIKEASGKTFVGGGTPPTFMGEGYANFGAFGTFFSAALLIGLVRVFGTRVIGGLDRAGVSSTGYRMNLALYGYVLTWSVLAQVAGLAGASTVPLAGFLVLYVTHKMSDSNLTKGDDSFRDQQGGVGSTTRSKVDESKYAPSGRFARARSN
ncbi:oligosaccharide flippase family protein [Rhodococcus sp. UNC23MFCrub1.1]|uniref:oligosaccharide flippase family protein n=1 Tax=Rhodococcus sp. UNC23MFCrub1.1 TaxID=1449068 RepID=UPI0009DF0304|nr:polysaccharide biosynthesis C-terminal domain-containing protein [Rhodococcus sp. UNC23MFCrub1.1]